MHDATYFRTRAASHLHQAAHATHPQAREIHFQLANLYQARSGDIDVTPHAPHMIGSHASADTCYTASLPVQPA